MLHREWRFLIDDIVEAVDKIQNYTADMSFKEFKDDEKTFDAVVRNFIIIGEAASHLPSEIKEKYPDIPWRLMADMRNFAVHQYWGVDLSVIWKTIQEDLTPLIPLLKAAKDE